MPTVLSRRCEQLQMIRCCRSGPKAESPVGMRHPYCSSRLATCPQKPSPPVGDGRNSLQSLRARVGARAGETGREHITAAGFVPNLAEPLLRILVLPPALCSAPPARSCQGRGGGCGHPVGIPSAGARANPNRYGPGLTVEKGGERAHHHQPQVPANEWVAVVAALAWGASPRGRG